MSKARSTSERERGTRSRWSLLEALVALLPTVAERKDIGFTRAEREDALMDAILRVLEAEQRSDPAGASSKEIMSLRYAARVVQNQLIDRLRSQRDVLVPLERRQEASPPGEDEPESPAHRRRREISAALIAELREDDQTLLSAYLNGSDSFREEYARLRIQPSAARVKIHRILKGLRERGLRLVAGEE